MRACFGSFEKPRGKILHNHSISLQDRSDSEMEGKIDENLRHSPHHDSSHNKNVAIHNERISTAK